MKSIHNHLQCPISGSSDIHPIEGFEAHHLHRCSSSGFVFSLPIPSAEELNAHYATYNRALEISELTIARYREILKSFEPYRKSNKLFDIGCGMGDFLEVAKQMGWDVYGNEFTPEAVAACSKKRISIELGAPNTEWFEENSFDIVTSFEVIEHLSFPMEHVSFAHHLLKQGGLFYCTTPNFNAIERYLLKSEYNVIQFPEHLSYFTKNTLNQALSQGGFDKKQLTSSGISPARIRNSLRSKSKVATTDRPAASSDDGLRDKLESNQALGLVKRVVNTILDFTGTGNALKATYIKR